MRENIKYITQSDLSLINKVLQDGNEVRITTTPDGAKILAISTKTIRKKVKVKNKESLQ